MKDIQASLHRAFKKRESLLRSPDTTAIRLLSEGEEGTSGLVLERLGPVVIAQIHEEKASESLSAVGEFCEAELCSQSIYGKFFVSDRSHERENPDLKSRVPAFGIPAAEEFPVRENGHVFLVRPYDGFSTGLFLDQRENRSFLAGLKASTALNLFAYTCAFSVTLAKSGSRLTSVDLAPRFLDWGKRNFLANGLHPNSHDFVAMDAFAFLERASDEGRSYDLVVVDPPSFSRNREGVVFSLKTDFERLFQASFKVVGKGGRLYFSSNLSSFTSEVLKEKVNRMALPLRFLECPLVPLDFQWEQFPLARILVERLA